MSDTKQYGLIVRGEIDTGASVSMTTVGREEGAIVAHESVQIDLNDHHLTPPIDERLVLAREPDSDRAAAYRVLRHHLQDMGSPQVIVISSPNPGDGKTTCAANLAMALAECGRARVLLLDVNLRRPSLARAFAFAPPWCVAEQLASHRDRPLLPWSVVQIPELWLHVAAVDPRERHAQILDAPAFAIAINRLRRAGYDHIVIDAPSVLHTADVNLIQDVADGVLLAVRRKRTTARDIRNSIDQLGPGRVLGTVLIE